MRKLFLIFISLFCFSICFAADIPSVSGKGGIRPDLPPDVTPPTTIFKTENITGPLPTNKWFNSILYGCYNFNPSDINNNSFKMYTYPQVIKCDDKLVNGLRYGLLIEAPKVMFSDTLDYEINYGVTRWGNVIDEYPNALKISPYKNCFYNTTDVINSSNNGAKLDKFSDWASTAMWIDDSNSSKWMKATFGQGFLFTYFEFPKGIYPAIEFPYDWETIEYGANYRFLPYDTKNGQYLPDNLFRSAGDEKQYINDSLLLQINLPNKKLFYAIFVPEGTEFFQVEDTAYDSQGQLTRPWIKISIKFPESLSDEERFISTALLPSTSIEQAKKDMKYFYKYAHNFVSNTTVDWNIETKNNTKYAKTNFNFSFYTKANITSGKLFGETINFESNKTFFCLLPHQYKATSLSATTKLSKNEIQTLRGNLKIYEGNNFYTENKVCGIVPFFQLDKFSSGAEEKIRESLQTDKNLPIDPDTRNSYFYGKSVAKFANLIPVADNLSDISSRSDLITKVKNELTDWFTYSAPETSKYFAFDQTWGGLIGIYNGFGTENYNDHHFHYGYFVYAAAIIAMYDNQFASDYGNMVNLLIRDFANTERNDSSFPFMRNFDFYESHSWANGMGGSDDNGTDIESSSEAMNAWAAIYMWGLATNNQKYIDLGLYLYTSEYQAIKNYFFVTGNDSAVKNIFQTAGYKKTSVGILYAGVYKYKVHWGATDERQIKGIHLLPMTSSLLYLSYDLNYDKNDFYNENSYTWNDIWTKFRSLYDAQGAWVYFDQHHSTSDAPDAIDDGGTATYTYHFIDFFRQNGNVQTEYSASIPSYLVTKKNNINFFSVYNYSNTTQTVNFYNSNGENIGYMTVPAKTFKTTAHLKKDSEDEKLLIYPVPYKPSNESYGGTGIHFENLPDGSNIKIFNVAGELVYETTIENANKDFVWNVRNNSGNKIASGIYVYYIVSSDGTKYKGKLAIER